MSIVRIYDSEEDGLVAAREVEQAGFETVHFLAASAAEGQEEEAVRYAQDAGCVASAQRKACVAALKNGQSVVAVSAPFGKALLAEQILGQHGPVDGLEVPPSRNPAPFSDALGIAVLADWTPSSELSTFQFTFGEPNLSRRPAPFSGRLGMKQLTAAKSKRSSFGLPLLSDSAAPFSSMFRMPTLTRPKSKSSSFGLPLLTKRAAPFSALFGIRVLSNKNESDRR